MISVLLAEDEELEMRALAESIDYASLGMEIAGKAYNGEEALRLVETLRPDLLITDIVMPKISGIELARRAKELNPDIRVLIITGHQRFDYASLAIECGVEGFLIKPLFPEKLRELLQNAARKIAANNRRLFAEKLYDKELRANLPMLRELFARTLIEGDVPPDACERLEYYGVLLEDAPLAVFCLLTENGDGNDMTMLSLRRCAAAFMEKESRRFCCAGMHGADGETLFIMLNLEPDENAAALGALAGRLGAAVFADCGFSVTIGVSAVAAGLAGIHECAAQASGALRYRFYLGEGNVIFSGDVATPGTGGDPQTIRRLFPSLLACAGRGDREEVERRCAELHAAAANCSLPPEYMRMIFAELMNGIASSGYESGIDADNASDRVIAVLRAGTLDELTGLIRRELIARSESVGNYIKSREQWLAEQIREVITTQYSRNLSVDDIAAQVYISSGYAARLFRKLTGESIVAFLTRTRMEAAARILTDPRISIREAAEAVGYVNIAYFSSVFRKTYNCTPREYRDANIKE